MTHLTAICLCVLLWASCPEPVSRHWFDLVSKQAGLELDYGNPEHHEIVRKLIEQTFRGGKR